MNEKVTQTVRHNLIIIFKFVKANILIIIIHYDMMKLKTKRKIKITRQVDGLRYRH